MDGDVVVCTPRLAMRPLTAAYLPEMLDLYSDPEVTRFLKPLDEAGHLGRLRETEQMWASRGYGRVAIHERDTGRFLGRGGLHYWDQFGEVEVGWVLRADAQGRGYATEAGRAWVRWAFEHLPVPYVTACISPDNQASRAVADRLGMSVIRADQLHGREVLVFAVHRKPGAHSGPPAAAAPGSRENQMAGKPRTIERRGAQ